MIEVEKLNKSYGEIRAVKDLSFRVEPGEIYGLLGPNGAGKSTTLSMAAGLLAPDSGSIRYGDLDLAKDPLGVKALLGVVPQENALYENLSAREHLRFWGGFYGLSGSALKEAVARVLDQVDLSGRADEPSRGFSGGMKRRLNLALGLIHDPQVVLLDEPTVGIDPQARLKILEVVRGLTAGGTSVIYTTHYLEEAEDLCDRIAVVDHGEILVEGTLEELQEMVGGEEIVRLRGGFAVDDLEKKLAGRDGLRVISRDASHEDKGGLVLAVAAQQGEHRSIDLLGELFRVGEGDGLALDRISIEPPSLNGLFLKLTGRELRD